MLRSFSYSNDCIPVSDALFGRIMRSKPQEVVMLVSGLPVNEQARLALFCNARSHLREIGQAIAAQCDEASLALEGGPAGIALFAQVRAGSVESKTLASTLRTVITLAQRPAPLAA